VVVHTYNPELGGLREITSSRPAWAIEEGSVEDAMPFKGSSVSLRLRQAAAGAGPVTWPHSFPYSLSTYPGYNSVIDFPPSLVDTVFFSDTY
jgi:hypothetical protein